VFFCYGRGKSLKIKNNFIYLDREGVIKWVMRYTI
jgi:hypothetical protein